jgi:hypothetical protein
MTERCFRLDELDSILDLDPEDPRRRHLAECPLCRARLAAYRAFIAEGPAAPGSQPERAKADLEAFIARITHAGAQPKTRSGLRARLREFRVPRFVLVPGLATAAVVAIILILVLRPFSGGDRELLPSLRGLESPTAGRVVLSAQPAALSGTTINFSWSPLSDSDRYQVEVFNAKLEEVARFEAAGDTSLTVQTNRVGAAAGTLWWRVVAFRDGDEIAHSPLSSLNLGPR